MNAFDIGAALVSAFFLARGIWVGIIRQIAFLVALFFGFFAAARFHGEAYPTVSLLVENQKIAFLLTYVALFVMVYLATMVIGLLLRKVVQFSLLGWFDRLLGGMFGAGKAVMVTSLVFMTLSSFLPASSAFLQEAFLYPYLLPVSRLLLMAVSDERLRGELLPRDPAILERFLPGNSAIPPGEARGRGAQQVRRDKSQVDEGKP